MQQQGQQYQRNYERFPLGSQAIIDTEKIHGILSIVADLSSRGAGIISTVPFDPGENITITINRCFLFSEPIRRKAKVVWSKHIEQNLWQTGVDFGVDNLIDFAS
ncbi:MAG: PilZ domain-containing protein [Candidatus Omnitrophica bacterium]|nr:PilZ domain-containing protein [Candidatus Omnitrophota bacterium]